MKSTNGRHGSMYMVGSNNEASIIGQHMLQLSCGRPSASSSCWQSYRGWQSQQIDFILAYMQAPAEVPLYMKLPQGYDSKYLPEGVTKGSHILKLLCNIYGNKVAGHIWNKYVDRGFQEAGFKPSKVDPCLYYKGGGAPHLHR